MAASSPDPDHPLVATLRAAGCVFAEEEAALLLAEAAARDAREPLEVMVGRRVGGEPLEQVLGWAEFAGLRIRVAPGVFVPRQRTVLLVDLAVALAPTSPVVVDLCCGTGAVGAALARRLDAAEVHAADLDPAAVACARLNLPAEAVHQGDLYAALPGHLRGRVDVLAVNAPYVPTDEIALMPADARDHEHRIALDGGPDGLDLHRRVAGSAPAWLSPGGVLLLETSRRQADRTAAACAAAGLEPQVHRRDGATVVTAISGGSVPSGTMAR